MVELCKKLKAAWGEADYANSYDNFLLNVINVGENHKHTTRTAKPTQRLLPRLRQAQRPAAVHPHLYTAAAGPDASGMTYACGSSEGRMPKFRLQAAVHAARIHAPCPRTSALRDHHHLQLMGAGMTYDSY